METIIPDKQWSKWMLEEDVQIRLLKSNPVPILFSLPLILGGAVAMHAEWLPFHTSNTNPNIRLLELSEGETEYGLTTSSRHVLLFECRRAMSSLMAAVQIGAIRRSLNENCLAASDSIVSEQPTLSMGWVTGALSAAGLGDWDGFNRRLENSYRTAPTEQWIATARVSYAEEHFARLTDLTKAGNMADIVLLTERDSGLVALARVYLQLSGSRERINAAIEQRPLVTRMKFLRKVRLLLQGAEL